MITRPLSPNLLCPVLRPGLPPARAAKHGFVFHAPCREVERRDTRGPKEPAAHDLAADREHETATEAPSELLDPASRAAMQLAPPRSSKVTTAGPAHHGHAAQRAAELHATATAVVERAAFWGDGTRGLARLRFSSQARHGLAGGTIILEHDGARVELRVEGVGDEAAASLIDRLRRRGIEVNE